MWRYVQRHMFNHRQFSINLLQNPAAFPGKLCLHKNNGDPSANHNPAALHREHCISLSSLCAEGAPAGQGGDMSAATYLSSHSCCSSVARHSSPEISLSTFLPRSDVLSVGAFFRIWNNLEHPKQVLFLAEVEELKKV